MKNSNTVAREFYLTPTRLSGTHSSLLRNYGGYGNYGQYGNYGNAAEGRRELETDSATTARHLRIRQQ